MFWVLASTQPGRGDRAQNARPGAAARPPASTAAALGFCGGNAAATGRSLASSGAAGVEGGPSL
ncbi:hypothetical protein XMIN_4471 [Xanthomonas citri pv. mangiferaeindicae LMG 941]|nr:hypothetical protein Xcnt_20755 [Xanthomonas campestris pv. centellae]CCG39473.1 hypothetical protein XMIN_4471 [Xanthomonas citri pv. mangiferaeindicae LMG 941]